MHNRLLRSQLVLLICFISIPVMAVGPFYSPRLVGMSQWVEHNLAVATNAADARDRLGITTGSGSGETNRNLSSDTGSGYTLVATPDHSGTTNLLRSLTFIGFVSVSTNGSNITVTITQSGETNTASSLGSGTSIIAGKSGTVLQFNSITGAGGTTVLSNANTLTISNNASGGAGDFMADGSVPMTGPLNFGLKSGTNLSDIWIQNFNATQGPFNDEVDGLLITNTIGDGQAYFGNGGAIAFSGSETIFSLASRSGGLSESMAFFVSSRNFYVYDAINGACALQVSGATGVIAAPGLGAGYDPNYNDGTETLIQSASGVSAGSGAYWCQGTVGVSSINVLCDDGNLHPIVGGIIQ